jgi:Putative MetA-pathway of phenol degradation
MTRPLNPRPPAAPISRFAVAAALLAALAVPATAVAAHPLVSDDAGTLGASVIQFELGAAGARDQSQADGVRLQEEASLLVAAFGWGLRDDLDLVLGLPLAWSRSTTDGSGTSTVSGVGDVVLEAKWRFLEVGRFGLAMKAGLALPTGDAVRGLGTGRPAFGAALLATQELGPVALTLNAAFASHQHARVEDRAGSRPSHWHASAALEGEVTAGLRLVANLGLETSTDRAVRTPSVFALGGLIHSVTESFDVDLGVKVGLTNPEPDLVLLAGLAARF